MQQFSTESSESFSSTPPHTQASTPMFSDGAAGAQYSSPSPRAKPKRRMNEDRLGPFTDYSGRRRPPFQRAVTIANPGYCAEFPSPEVKPSSGRRDSRSGTGRTSRKDSLGLSSDLYNRRKMKAMEKLRQAAKDLPKKAAKRSKGGRVTFSDPPSQDPSPIPPTKRFYIEGSGDSDRDSSPQPQARNSDSNVKVQPGSNLDTSFLRPASLPKISSSSNMLDQINPIVTPNRSDYTTITDEIDTTGLNYTSPSTSPTTPKASFFRSIDVDVDLYTKKGFSAKDVIQSELEQLRMAEDAEHEQMELMIMRRMRQISLTESESLSDIARHVIQELESDDETPEAARGADFHSDEDLPKRGATATSPEQDPAPQLTRVSSEPTIKGLGGSLEREYPFRSGAKSGSLSPPVPSAAGKFDLPQRSSTLEDTSQQANETSC